MGSEALEHLSALMDGEIESQKCGKLIKKLATNADARGCWERFHLSQDLLADKELQLAADSFARGVAERIENEPHVIASATWLNRSIVPSKGLWKQIAGVGIAASVMAAAVTGVYLQRGIDTELQQSPVAVQYNIPINSVVQASARVDLSPQLPDLRQRQRLDQLFLEHTQTAADIGIKGLLPYAQVISYGHVSSSRYTNMNSEPRNP